MSLDLFLFEFLSVLPAAIVGAIFIQSVIKDIPLDIIGFIKSGFLGSFISAIIIIIFSIDYYPIALVMAFLIGIGVEVFRAKNVRKTQEKEKKLFSK